MEDALEFQNSIKDSKTKSKIDSGEFKVYKRRWFTLALSWLLAIAVMMQFMIYSIASDVLVTYYEISYPDAGWSTTICMVSYLIFTISGSYILDVYDLRTCALITSVGACLGGWIKIGSVDSSRYWVLLLGQAVTASVQSIIISMPLKVAAVWFGRDEVSTACGLGILGGLTGLLISMILPPLLIESDTMKQIENSLSTLAYIVAIYSTIVLLAIVIFFKKAPPTPPSYAQFTVTKEGRNFMDYLKSLKRLLCNRSFIFLLLLNSLILGVTFPMMINLNQLITSNYPDSSEHVGYMLTVNQISGLVGTFIAGIVLDKYQLFRLSLIGLSILSSLSCILFVELIPLTLYVTYATAIFMGATVYGLYTVSIELGVEVTYPEPQSTSGTLLYAAFQTTGIALTYTHALLLSNVSTLWANMVLYVIVIIGNLFLFGMRYDLKRKSVENELTVTIKQQALIN